MTSGNTSSASLNGDRFTPANAFSPRGAVPVSVVILTRNEELNIADCIRSCAWSDDVHVLDSNSTDRTAEIARQMGATVHQNAFESFGRQRNWAIDHITHKHDWVFHIDADERFTPLLVEEMGRVIRGDVALAGFFVPHQLMFMRRWIKRSEGSYPIYQMRFFHRHRMRFCDFGHGQRESTQGAIGHLEHYYIHYGFSKGIEDWLARHNRYSTLEAMQIFAGEKPADDKDQALFGNTIQRRRFMRSKIYPSLPAKWFWRFVWMYLLRLGILEGRAGLYYCLLMSYYELSISLKLEELRTGEPAARAMLAAMSGQEVGSSPIAGTR